MGSSVDRPYDDLIGRRQNDGLAITRVPPTPSEKHADRSAGWTGLGITLFVTPLAPAASFLSSQLGGRRCFLGDSGPAMDSQIDRYRDRK